MEVSCMKYSGRLVSAVAPSLDSDSVWVVHLDCCL